MEEDISQSAPSTAEVTAEKETQAPSQEPVRTEKEKAAYSLKKTAERLRELGEDPAQVLGVKPELKVDETLSDDQPLTIRDLRNIQKQDAHQTSLQMAEAIEDEVERLEVTRLLQGRIVPSGNAQEDLRLARAAVNSERNAKIVAELDRRGQPRNTAAGGSMPASFEDPFEPTPEEKQTMDFFGMTKEKVLEARKRFQSKQPPAV